MLPVNLGVCNSRGMYFIPLDLQGAYPRYEIHTSVFAVCSLVLARPVFNGIIKLQSLALYTAMPVH